MAQEDRKSRWKGNREAAIPGRRQMVVIEEYKNPAGFSFYGSLPG
ncbi:MAG: hypothetical protein ACI4E4_00340 [Acetatifactor sp.]